MVWGVVFDFLRVSFLVIFIHFLGNSDFTQFIALSCHVDVGIWVVLRQTTVSVSSILYFIALGKLWAINVFHGWMSSGITGFTTWFASDHIGR